MTGKTVPVTFSVDKAALLAMRVAERRVSVGELGHVMVRGITRDEVGLIQQVAEGIEREAATIALAMVAPVLTPDEVRAWMSTAPGGLIDKVSRAIGELSGLLESSQKDAYKSV